MATCCGGKNAGKPISWTRYLAGCGVFFTYHSAVAAALHVAALADRRLVHVRDFHREVFLAESREVLQRRDININGPEPERGCEIALPEAVAPPSLKPVEDRLAG